MKKRKAILIVSPYFHPEGGGLERYAFDMAKKLAGDNDVEVLCMTRGPTKRTEEYGFKVHRIKPAFIISNTPVGLKFVFELARRVKGKDKVIGHTPVPFAADVASIFAKVYRIPFEVVYHTVGLKKGARFLDLIGSIYALSVERLTLKGADITSVSRKVWGYLKSRGYNSKISHPSISEELIEGASNELTRRQRRNAILFVGQLGRYHRFKNPDLLLRAFSRLSHKYPSWELWVAGGGDMKDEYTSMASDLGISQKVRFLGAVDPPTLAQLYSTAKILVLPSSFESFGMVVLEAQTFGLPVVISSEVGSKTFVLDGKTGLILGDIEVESLTAALETLMENPKQLRKMSLISRKFIKSRIRACP
jgi:glycosyltransferase involved in cell wall biosynthesis